MDADAPVLASADFEKPFDRKKASATSARPLRSFVPSAVGIRSGEIGVRLTISNAPQRMLRSGIERGRLDVRLHVDLARDV